jgi:hypothetical protein
VPSSLLFDQRMARIQSKWALAQFLGKAVAS